MTDAEILNYVQASATALGLPMDAGRTQRVAVHLTRTAALAQLLIDTPMEPHDELAEIYKPLAFQPPSNMRSTL
jgi:hypothetical protein